MLFKRNLLRKYHRDITRLSKGIFVFQLVRDLELSFEHLKAKIATVSKIFIFCFTVTIYTAHIFSSFLQYQ